MLKLSDDVQSLYTFHSKLTINADRRHHHVLYLMLTK